VSNDKNGRTYPCRECGEPGLFRMVPKGWEPDGDHQEGSGQEKPKAEKSESAKRKPSDKEPDRTWVRRFLHENRNTDCDGGRSTG
jgi:hypothetical protein